MALKMVREFREKLAELPREDIMDLIREQNPDLIKQVNRIEWVFENKLRHLNWSNGDPIMGRPLTNEELALLVDPPFMPDPDMTAAGISKDQQREIHIAADPVLWAKHYLRVEPRAYQVIMIRDPALRKVFRLGRRAGKTFSMAVILLHYAHTTTNGRCLVMAPMKSQVGLIYDEVMMLAKQGAVIDAIKRNVSSPQHEIELTNGSTIRLFTTGLKSGSKSDVARGQEAHIIILDEMDYMGAEDLDALYAMLQVTSENQPEKQMIGASTPTGRRERFWEWCVRSDRFKEFYYPSYCNPHWDKELEDEMRDIYTEMAYRHEIEADWGEDAEGVYPRKYVDMAFADDWDYVPGRTSARSFYLMGVDWDKYGAGPNIVVLEVCQANYEDERFANKVRVAYRQEIPRTEYVLTEAIERIIELNSKFQPEHIYVDRGFGEMQIEILHKYGLENPQSQMKKRVRGISFSQSKEVRDPATKEMVKKPMKPFMVENLRSLLERGMIKMPNKDEELYMQLISYIVSRTTEAGMPKFEASGTQQDHAHDALILASLAYAENYDELLRERFTTRTRSFSNETFMPTMKKDPVKDEIKSSDKSGRAAKVLNRRRRRSTPSGKSINRKMF